MTGRLRLAVVQCSSQAADVQANLARLAETAHAAAAGDAQLVVFPEMYLTGYNIGEWDIRDLAQSPDGPAMQFIRQTACDADMHICVGYPERASDGQIYNSALICDPRGRVVLNYRKSHLFGDTERKVFTRPGPQLPLAVVHGVSVGLLICYDVEFPRTFGHWRWPGRTLSWCPPQIWNRFMRCAKPWSRQGHMKTSCMWHTQTIAVTTMAWRIAAEVPSSARTAQPWRGPVRGWASLSPMWTGR